MDTLQEALLLPSGLGSGTRCKLFNKQPPSHLTILWGRRRWGGHRIHSEQKSPGNPHQHLPLIARREGP